jgi:hypothetical protein
VKLLQKLLLFAELGAAIGLLFCKPPLAVAANGRDFAGLYGLRDVGDFGPEFRAAFSARVFNYSNADITGGTLIPQGSLLSGQAYCTIAGVSIHDPESVRPVRYVALPSPEGSALAARRHVWLIDRISRPNKPSHPQVANPVSS